MRVVVWVVRTVCSLLLSLCVYIILGCHSNAKAWYAPPYNNSAKTKTGNEAPVRRGQFSETCYARPI